MRRVNKLLKSIYIDKASGSSVLTAKLFKVLRGESLKVKNINEFLYFLDFLRKNLKRHHPLLFQLQNLVNIIYRLAVLYGIESIYDEINAIEENFKNSGFKVAQNFLKWLSKKGGDKFSIATLSHSGTVLNSLAYVKEMVSEVYIFRSCPNCEGEKMAKEAAKRGLNVFLVNDFALDYVLNVVDFVVSGCDAMFLNGDILNKAGTSAIFKFARGMGKETMVFSDFLKIVRERLDYGEILSKAIRSGRRRRIQKVDLIFEIVSSEFISYYITDMGIFVNKDEGEYETIYSLFKMFGLWGEV